MADLRTILHFVARFLNDSEHSHQFLFLRGTANELRLGKRIDRCRLVCFHLPRKLREVQSFDMRSRVEIRRKQPCNAPLVCSYTYFMMTTDRFLLCS